VKEGFDFADAPALAADGVAMPVAWKGPLALLKGQPVRLEFEIRNARLHAFALE
jgi:hypothetical protein